jgi:hypothetical protein
MARRCTLLAILWLWLVPLLHGKEAAQESLRAYVVKRQGRQAYGIYVESKKIGAQKIGWFVDELKLGKYQGKEVAVHFSEAHMVTNSNGEKSVLHETATVYYQLDGDGAILAAEEVSQEDKTRTRRTAVRDRDGLLLTTRSGKRKTERRTPLSRDTLDLMRRLEHWLTGNPLRGATFDNFALALDQEKIDTHEVYKYQSKKDILWGGVTTTVYLVRVSSQKANFDTEMKADGTIVKGRIGGIFTMRAEKEALARKMDGAGVDLLAASSVFVDRRLGEASRVQALTLEASGLGDFVLPTSHRQRVTAGKDGTVVLKLKRDERVKQAVALAGPERTRYLRATPSIQSDDARLRKLAGKVVGRETDPVRVATRLEKWVHKNLRQTMAANASTALDVLENRAGDCTEHTLLFVALARAAGLPAREVGGLAYSNGRRPLFGWHAWAEIHDGAQWVSVDPTWNQVYVDATHIKFSEGSEDLAWANVVGKLTFKVVTFERKK